MEPFAIFPDDLEDDYLPAASAAMQAMAERTSYVKKSRRDYSVALAMVAPKAEPAARQMMQPVDNISTITTPTQAAMIPQPPVGFVSKGVTGPAVPALDTSGVSSFLSGETPEGAHLFELSFNEGVLGGLRCSLSTLNGVVTATFHVNNYEAAQKLEVRLPQLRQMLESKGLKIDQLNVQIS